MGSDPSHDAAETPNHTALFEELPTTLPIDARWWLSNPDRVVVDHTPGREDDRKSVDNERGIEVLKIARTQHNGGDENAGPQGRPRSCSDLVGGADDVGREFCLQGILSRQEHACVEPPEKASHHRQQQESGPNDSKFVAT